MTKNQVQEHANGALLVEIRNHVAHLTLNRPAALNALSHAMITGLAELFSRWVVDDNIKAVVMRGAGEKAFCAGGDIRALREAALQPGHLYRQFFIDEYRLDYQLHRFVKPVVCILDGIVMGGGMGISQGSGYRIVGPRTKMAMPETAIGLFPDVGGSFFLSQSPVGLYLALTGQTITGAEAMYAKLADRHCSSEAISQLLKEMDHVQWSKNAAHDVGELVAALPTLSEEVTSLELLKPAIDRHFVPGFTVAEMVDSLESERRDSAMEWATKTAALLKKRSPTLLEVTRRQINRGRKQSLASSFRMELDMVFHAFEHGDVLEGIRALMIDKDNAPQWKPRTLAEVEPEQVAAFFTSPWEAHAHPLANLETLYG